MSGEANSLRVWFPSDPSWRQAAGQQRTLAGRVKGVRHGAMLLCDALVGVRVQFAEGVPPPPEDALVRVVGYVRGDELCGAQVQLVQPRSPEAEAMREHGRLFEHGVGRNLVLRAAALRAIRDWFDREGFVEVDTPQRVVSPGLDLHLDAFESGDRYLVTSPEYQMKRLLVGGMPRIYQLVHCFRDGERGAWHASEFLMLEWYRAFAEMHDVVADTERLIAHIATRANGAPWLVVDGRRIGVAAPFERIAVGAAFERFAGIPAAEAIRMATEAEDEYFRVMVERVEPGLAAVDHGVVLDAFPAPHASLARLHPSDPRVCERFEVYVAGRELCNGFGELTDPVEQRDRLQRDQRARARAGKPVYPIDEEFVRALQEGMPPSAGNALGVDRLLALCVGAGSLADVLALPDPLP
ncbi:MAG: EF-P lysine aminoacylase EpmA [Polyangiaceae bacterium]|jgi:lysyl-tRNA synthetase class 2|nr:EF-P lysine aminoacylase EpmA [Polyangiaceae bacterium]